MPYYKKNSRDPRYVAAKLIIEADKVRTLPQLFKIIRKTVVLRDLGMKSDRFTACMREPAHFKLKHIFGMAELIGVDKYLMYEIVSKYWENRSPKTFIKLAPPVKRLDATRRERRPHG